MGISAFWLYFVLFLLKGLMISEMALKPTVWRVLWSYLISRLRIQLPIN